MLTAIALSTVSGRQRHVEARPAHAPDDHPGDGEQDDHRAERRVAAEPELDGRARPCSRRCRSPTYSTPPPLSGNSIVGSSSWNPTTATTNESVRRGRSPATAATAGPSAAQSDELDELHDRDHADEDDALAADVEGDGGEHAEHHELRVGAVEHAAAGRDPVEPPHEDGDGEGVGILGEQLVGVRQQHRRGGEDGRDGERQQAPGPPADDAVDEHQPGAEAGHLDELQAVVVEAPQVDERRQQQRPAPRVGVRAEAPAGVDHREAVVGDDLADVAVEDAAGLAQVEREVVALGVAVAVQGDGQPGPTATTMPRATPLASRLRGARTVRRRRRRCRARGRSSAAGLTDCGRAAGSPPGARPPCRG